MYIHEISFKWRERNEFPTSSPPFFCILYIILFFSIYSSHINFKTRSSGFSALYSVWDSKANDSEFVLDMGKWRILGPSSSWQAFRLFYDSFAKRTAFHKSMTSLKEWACTELKMVVLGAGGWGPGPSPCIVPLLFYLPQDGPIPSKMLSIGF